MTMVVSITCYFIAVFLSVQIAAQRYRKMTRINGDRELDGQGNIDASFKMTLTMAIVIALLFTLYNVIVTHLNVSISGDRQNYTLNFFGYRNSSSAGLMFLIGLIRKVSSRVETLYYVSTFITMLITMLAYRESDEATPKAILFLLTTQYVFFTFAGMKQCYANAFASLCIVLALRHKGIGDAIVSIILIALSMWFHPTGYLLIPLYIMIRIKKTRRINTLFFLLMIVGVLFLEPLLLRAARLAAPFAPGVAVKIYDYFGETGNEALEAAGFMSALKGIPFYIITLVGWIKRRELKDQIPNYENYLFLSGVISFIYVASVYNSWVNRLAYFLYLPVGIFFVQLMRNVSNENNYRIINASVIGINTLFTLLFVILVYMNYGGF